MSAVESVLDERRRVASGRPAAGVALSAVLHLLAVGVIVLAPRLNGQRARPIEYVPVTILPIQALGAPPRPAPPEPKPKPAAKAPEEPPPPAREPDPEIPVVTKPKPPDPKPAAPKPEKKPEPTPGPTDRNAQEAAAAPTDTTRAGAATGSVAGQSAFGTTQVATLDNPDFTYGYYLDQMLRLIRERWARPPLGGEVQATVHFVIRKDGRVEDVEIRESSGYSSFDLAGLRAVQSASPLPPLPRSYRRETLGVSLIIR